MFIGARLFMVSLRVKMIAQQRTKWHGICQIIDGGGVLC